MPEVSISQYTESDKEGLLAAIIELQETERALTDTKRPGQEIAAAYLADILKSTKEKQGVIFVAHAEGKVAGFISCWVLHEDNITETVTYGYISDTCVMPEYRRLGIYKALNLLVEKHFAQFPEVSRIRICVLNDNEPALLAYEKTGYKKFEIILEKKV